MGGHPLNFAHRFIPASVAGSPTLLLLHGTGGNEDDLLFLGQEIAPGSALLSPRGKVLERGMPRFFRRLADGVFDLEDLRFRTNELADFVEAAAEQYGFDTSHVIAAGYSNGANIGAALMLQRPKILMAGMLFHAMVPLEPELVPDLRGKSAFITSGATDTIIPPEAGERLAELLRRAGAEVVLHREKGGHRLASTEVSAARAWLAAAVNPRPTPESR